MNIIFFITLFPFLGFLFLSCVQDMISKKIISNTGILTIFISFLTTCFYVVMMYKNNHRIFVQKLWNWLSINDLKIDCSFLIDGLSLSMLFLITGIGLLVHIYSSWYMKYKEGYSRFFAYINLFIASMSLLVLANNLLFMYLGWEGVSVCSYLLIGFYYNKLNNCHSALKAFILTRISDVFLMIGIFLIYRKYDTFNFEEIKFLSNILNTDNIFDLNLITFFLLIGVIGKSAQLPLHTWLTDAMVGPSPVSALIHAATMVTAGVYLIARMHFLFLLTPKILYFIGLLSVLTILVSSISALFQKDIKRILAYSTMSQIGYMFLALSVQAWSAAIMHLIIHGIFKALLFLSAGSLIVSCKNQKNIFKMGGLRKKLPFLYINFIVGGASLVSFPLITSGFYSKGNILFNVLKSEHFYFFLIALFCSFLTALYTFRMIFLVFHGHGHENHQVVPVNNINHNLPLCILLVLSTVLGSYISPPLFYVFPISFLLHDGKFIIEVISSVLSIFGIYLSYLLWIKNPYWINKFLQYKFIKKIHYFFLTGWGFDYFYNVFFVNFYLYISIMLSCDPLDKIINYFLKIIRICNICLLKSSNGYIRWYIFSIILGINIIFISIFLCWMSIK
ncbi:NADH-quinone oxidoreductase subunit L [Buchnera aphidicola (Macrosiphoniella sanborni)]|uniref:NADH-quinone oxidoreductase subunit L n=1 Tax=Buchnera aphidicola (Macrosiphoniella sanborni) TaxID=1241865 RepID=A0A4D6Y3V9_9GAMM|nr:NADH-quinone oxidoreductase subunit L [Buchnera aphidicola]QCI23719.1 NADH-quinone oxidoreductase subunit L [Buchnera aphidicola (Macrosiphoniella sanborni)]